MLLKEDLQQIKSVRNSLFWNKETASFEVKNIFPENKLQIIVSNTLPIFLYNSICSQV